MQMVDIGKALKENRTSRGLTQAELASKTGISQQNISRWEKNTHTPDILSCLTLSRFYEISIEELLGIE